MGTVLRKLSLVVDLAGNGTAELEDWNRELIRSRKLGDESAQTLDKMGREMSEYASKIGLSQRQLAELAKQAKKNNEIEAFAKQYGFAAEDIKKMRLEANNASGVMGKLGGAMKAVSTIGLTIGAGVIASQLMMFSTSSVKLAASAEQTRTSLEVMLGSAEKAQSVIGTLNQFSIKTPYNPAEVENAGKQFLAFGVKAENLESTLTTVGNVASGVGMDFNELASIYGKNLTQGVVQTEDLMQLAGRGIPIYEQMAKVFGVNTDQIKHLASTGQIKFEHLQQAFMSMTSEGGKYFGMMDKQSQTAIGLWSTMTGNVDELKKQFGNLLLDALKPLLEWFTDGESGMYRLKAAMIILSVMIGAVFVVAVYAAVAANWAFMVSFFAAFWPVIVIALAVAAAIGIIILIINDLYVFFTGGDSVFGSVLNAIKAKLQKVPESLKKIFNKILGFIKEYGKFFVMAIFPISILFFYWDQITGFIVKGVQFLIEKIKTYGKYVIMALFPISALYFYWDEISAWFKELPDKILGFFSGLGPKLKTVMKDILPDWAINLISKINTDGQSIEARATGGSINSGQTYLVGEEGPELFTSSSSGTIIPNGGLRSAGRNACNITIAPIINFTGNVSRDDGEYISTLITRKLEELFASARLQSGLEVNS